MGELKPQAISRLRDDFAFYMVANILPMGASVVGMAWVVRLVPPDQFGVFNLVSATASVVATGAFHWLCQWVLRYGTHFVSPDTRRGYWTVLLRSVAFALLLLVCAGLAVSVLRPGWSATVEGALLLCITMATQSVLVAVLQGAGRPRQYTLALAISTLIRWICTILFCYLWYGSTSLWWTLVWGQFIGQVAATVISLWVLRGNASFQYLEPNHRALQLQALTYGAPFVLWAISMQLLNVADRYVIQGFAGPQQVGTYSAIYNLSNAGVMVLTNPILLAFTPHIFRRAGTASSLSSNGDVRRLTENSLKLLLVIGVPLLAWSALLHHQFVTLVLGPHYSEGTIVFPIVVAGILVWQLAQILQKGFETAAQTKPLGSSIASAVVVNLLLNFLLVPRLGILGAALATVGAYSWYASVIFVRVAKFGRPQIATRSVVNVLIATGLSSSVLALASYLGSELWLRGFACIFCLCLYAAALFLLNESILTAQLKDAQRVFGAR